MSKQLHIGGFNNTREDMTTGEIASYEDTPQQKDIDKAKEPIHMKV